MRETTYSIGYSWAKALRRLERSFSEDLAIDRLEAERGDEHDVRDVAALLRRHEKEDAAREILRILPPLAASPGGG